jgi:hypothetical protein
LKKCIFICFAILILLSAPLSSFAKLSISPSVGIEERYNDNIFLSETDREDDFITTIMPGISVSYEPHTTMKLDLDYNLNLRFYSRHNELDDTSLREAQNIRFHNQYKPFNYFSLDISDVYRRIPIDIRESIAIENPFRNMTETNVVTLSPRITYPLTPTLSGSVGYSFTNVWYSADEGNNSDNHSVSASLIKKFAFNLNTSLEYEFSAYRPDKTEDTDKHQWIARVSYQFSQNGSVWVGGGMAYLEISQNDNLTTSIWDIGTDYTFGIAKGTSLGARYKRSISETTIKGEEIDRRGEASLLGYNDKYSVTAGITEIQTIDLYFQTGEHYKLYINPSYSINKEINTEREDKITSVSVSLSKALSEKAEASLHGAFSRYDFDPEDAKVYSYTVGGNIDYKLSRGELSFGYRYNQRDADGVSDEYYNNIVWIAARISF